MVDDTGYHAMPGVTKLADNSLLIMSRAGTSHLAGGNLVKFTGNSTGSIWSGATTVIDTAKDIRDVEVTTLPSGTVVCTYTERTEGVDDFVPKVITSTDGGATWSSPVTITHGFTSWGFVTAKVVRLASGNLLAPLYGLDSGGVSGTNDYAKVASSSDGGATWSVLATIASLGELGRCWQEPTICLRSTGDLVCALRSDNGTGGQYRIYTSTSTDDGASWSTPTYVFDGGGRPSIHETPEGALVIAYRDHTEGLLPKARWSFDDGVTWSGPHSFGADQPYVYGSWVDLSSGNLGLLWSVEEGSDLDANMWFSTFDHAG